jgi:hypothetical protein
MHCEKVASVSRDFKESFGLLKKILVPISVLRIFPGFSRWKKKCLIYDNA